MNVIETSTGKIHSIEILPVEDIDYKSLTKARYFFDWKEEKKQEVYKLVMTGSNEILGLYHWKESQVNGESMLDYLQCQEKIKERKKSMIKLPEI